MVKPKAEKTEAPEIKLSMTDHYIGILKLALEFNASVVAMVGSIVAADASGHNRSSHRRFNDKMEEVFAKYRANVSHANTKIIEQFFPTEAKDAKDDTTKS